MGRNCGYLLIAFMKANTNPIKEIVKDYMKKSGFRCKKNTWYRQCNDLIQALNIQKSAWGDQYYINLCFEYYDGTFLYPSEYKFPGAYMFSLSIRIEDAISNADFNALIFNIHYELEQRKKAIIDIFIKSIDYLNKNNSTGELKKVFKNKQGYLSVGHLRDIILE